MPDAEGRPRPEDYQPPLTRWGHAVRLLVMLLGSVFIWFTVAPDMGSVAFGLDIVLGLVTYVLVWWRRRHPLTIALVTVLLSSVSPLAAGPALLASASVATRRVWTQVVAVGIANLAAGLVFSEVYPDSTTEPFWVTTVTNVVFIAAMLATGMYVGSRRELLWTLRARAERAEAEQELRAGQSRLEERSRIAREMHDVLAHRISQISMRAGALGYRDDLSAAELRDEVTVIRDAANEALTDLRGVLGVLRDGDGGPQHTPQPTYADLGQLLDDARRGGLRVEYADGLADVVVPEATGRTLYRIVQEGITNARKHAPGAELTVDLHGSPDDGIEVVLANPLGFGPSTTPGAGLGLVGLAERAVLRGGRIEHGATDGQFVLRAWIPWAA